MLICTSAEPTIDKLNFVYKIEEIRATIICTYAAGFIKKLFYVWTMAGPSLSVSNSTLLSVVSSFVRENSAL